MHGFNQGISILNELCDTKTSVIFLQEMWLTSEAIEKNLSFLLKDYHLYRASGMDKTV